MESAGLRHCDLRLAAIRAPGAHEFESMSTLMTGVVEPLIAPHCNPSQRRTWLQSMHPDALAAAQGAGVRYAVAVLGGRVIGVGALRDVHHLFHLYVAAPVQGCGIGRRLWESLRDGAERQGARETYVNAWLDAVPVYRKFGFEPLGRPLEHLGVPRQPMIRGLLRS